MSSVKTSHSVDDLITEFDRLILNFEQWLKKIRPRTNVMNTRFGHLRRELDKFFDLEPIEMAKLSEIILKLNQLNVIFDNGIDFNEEDILRFIEGRYDLASDDKEKYHDFVFEFLMGVRFVLATLDSDKVSLSGQGDVTINDSIAIECKNIRSLNNLVKNVDKAKSQVEKRVAQNEVNFGFIALDISNIFPMEKVQSYLQNMFEEFAENHDKLKKFQQFDQSVVDSVLDDINFQQLVQSYIMHQAETSLYSALSLRYSMGSSVYGIMFQVNKCFVVQYEDLYLPIPTRGMTYILNPRLPEKASSVVQGYIHKLAVGF
ncbi:MULTISPECIES: hypothetical protein [Vibrio]|uniref:hypothetical protein n=1 Tax=Vibrio TaxID=662 RepID=UPI0028FC0FE9|nr:MULTISPECIES: hypothetical protein [Vibrio]MDW1552961.1 hypothetical protein [Vibrio sp. YT-18]WNW05093.1 hypothetical protein RO483_08985 [Vibrio alginolyticus]HCG8201883.1 hypothetical protein [Vibrio parahaemolyticus]